MTAPGKAVLGLRRPPTLAPREARTPRPQFPRITESTPQGPLLCSSCVALSLNILVREKVTCTSASEMSLEHVSEKGPCDKDPQGDKETQKAGEGWTVRRGAREESEEWPFTCGGSIRKRPRNRSPGWP